MLRRQQLLQSVVRAVLTKENFLALKIKQTARYHDVSQNIAEFEVAQSDALKAANSRADLVSWSAFVYMTGQWCLLFHWVYQRFDWNLVEPITYLLGFTTTWLCTFVYFLSGKEFTYNNVREAVVSRTVERSLSAKGLSLKHFAELQLERERLKQLLRLANIDAK
jgi:hypothetical protein